MKGIARFRRKTLRVLANSALWHLRYYSTGRAFPMAATFQLTNRCNLRCAMCNIPNNPAQATLEAPLFERIVRELSRLGCCYASLSGGEIMTIPDYPRYLALAKWYLPSVNAVTNGTLLDGPAARAIGKTGIDSISISLDGLEKTHELIRGRKGAFLKSVDAIENLRLYAPSIRVTVNTVITPWNIGELKELAMFVKALGVSHKFQPLNEHPSFEGQQRPYRVERTIDMKALGEFLAFLMVQENVTNSRYFLSSIPAYFEGRGSGGLFGAKCRLPGFMCEFREDGLMYPCLGGTAWKGGYPAGGGIRNILESSEYREDVERLKSCKGCTQSHSVCYIEPRVSFPAGSFLRYRLLGRYANGSR